MNRRFTLISVIFSVYLGLLLVGCGGSSDKEASGSSGSTASIDTRERFVLYDIQGKRRKWSEFAGQPLIVNFWATWCGPCRKEIPLLINIYKEFESRGLRIVGISVDHQRERVVPFVNEFAIPYPILYTDSQTPEEFGLGQGIPVTIFFDAEGNETGRIIGAQPPPLFYNQVSKLLES